MTPAVLEAPQELVREAQAGYRHGRRRPSLEERLSATWTTVSAGGVAECPVCRASMHPAGGVARCGDCGSTLS
jgi:hypothetical protein